MTTKVDAAQIVIHYLRIEYYAGRFDAAWASLDMQDKQVTYEFVAGLFKYTKWTMNSVVREYLELTNKEGEA